MRPINLKLRNFKSHADTDLDFTPMHIASITGSNGAGKSTILDGIVFALFGADGIGLGKRADTIVREGTDGTMVELTFELHAQRYRVRRGRRLLATSTPSLSLDRQLPDGEWDALTRATVKDTQAFLEELLGGDAEMFRRTTHIGQGDHARFSNATPAERKATLTQALDLGRYPDWSKAAGDHARAALAEVPLLEQRSDALAESTERAKSIDLPALEQAHMLATQTRNTATAALEEAKDAVGKLREGQAAGLAARQLADELERERDAAQQTVLTLTDQLHHARTKAATVDQWKTAIATPAAVDVAILESLEQPAQQLVDSLVDGITDLRRQADGITAKVHALTAAEQTATTRTAALNAITQRRDATASNRRRLDEAAPCCPTCEQTVTGAAHQAAVTKLQAELDALEQQVTDAASSLEQAIVATDEARNAIDPDEANRIAGELTTMETNLAAARAAVAQIRTDVSAAHDTNRKHDMAKAAIATNLAAAEQSAARAEELAAAIAAATAKHADLAARAATARSAAPTDGPDAELARLEQRQAQHAAEANAATIGIDQAAAALANAKATLETARKDREARAGVLAQIKDARAAHERWEVLRDAFGRDGIPAQVIRHARPQIEQDTNDLLAMFGAPYRLRMDLERETKNGVSDALDLTILVDGQERPYDLLSGGEQYRTNVALRLALAQVLANRAGTEMQTLILDEPDGLDAAGFSALADIIAALGQRFPLVLTVSHTNGLESACDTNIHVEKGDTGSTVLVAAA